MKDRYFKYFDIYQVLTLPLLLVLIIFSLEFRAENIKIGILVEKSPLLEHRAQNQTWAFVLAAKHINDSGGINGRQVQLLVRHHDFSAHSAAKEAAKLVYQDSVQALVGGVTPKATRAIQDVALKSSTPFLTPFCTHYEITDSGNRYTFRNISGDLLQFESIIKYLRNSIESDSPALIYDQIYYGSNGAEKFMQIATSKGLRIGASLTYAPETKNFRSQIDLILASNADSVILLAPAVEAAVIVRHLREAGFSKPILGGSSLSDQAFINYAGVYSESVLTTIPFNSRLGGSRADFFLSEFRSTFDTQRVTADAAMGYESMMVLALAMARADSTNIPLRDSLSEMHGWDSIAGSGGFDSKGNQTRPAELVVIKERQKVPLGMEQLF